ncbi:MAG: hypothetical protein H8E44_47765 [Planctomycetes bacterium]|nr:hypothetical protein [Planctomycetota bacterium]MBL7042152.1 hypothetical protein [Pirellulaceae bacterium]
MAGEDPNVHAAAFVRGRLVVVDDRVPAEIERDVAGVNFERRPVGDYVFGEEVIAPDLVERARCIDKNCTVAA